jgi:ATP adenylyltransferase
VYLSFRKFEIKSNSSISMELIYRSPHNPYSHLTAQARRGASFALRYLLSQQLIQGRVLDFGCGYGADVAFLRRRGFEVSGYDPYYAPQPPQGKFDTILCLHVLDVLLPEERAHVLMAVSELLHPEGVAFFAVRRDVRREGFRKHPRHGLPVYLAYVELTYPSLLRTERLEIYAYRPYNCLPHENPLGCPFCAPDAGRELLTETDTCYAILDKYPVTPGHALVIPKSHLSDYFDLPAPLKADLWRMVDRVKQLLSERFRPHGFNVGINVGTAAGQTIPHVHIHVIPRYWGDVENPRGGVRGVIPAKQNYGGG